MIKCTKCGELKDESEFYARYRHCKKCANRQTRAYYHQNKEDSKRRQKKLRDSRRSAGLCLACGKNKTEEGYKTCQACMEERRQRTKNLKQQVIEGYGGKCECCGESNPEFLTVDHINGGGKAHRESTGYGDSHYLWIINHGFPKDLRLLCMNCNFSIGHYGYCPHQMEGR